MNLNEKIANKRGLILKLLDRAGWKYEKVGNKYMGACPVCNRGFKTPNTAFNFDTNSFKCFSCETAGNLKTIAEHLNIDFKSFLEEEGLLDKNENKPKKDNKYQGLEDAKNTNKGKPLESKNLNQNIKNMDQSINIEKISTKVIEEDIKEYLKSRFIDPEKVNPYIRGLRSKQDKAYSYLENYYKEGYKLVIPSFDIEGTLKGVKIRNINGLEPKVKNLKGLKPYPLGMNEIFYKDENGEEKKHDTAIILEGEIDWLTAKSLFCDYNELFIALPSVSYMFLPEDKKSLPDRIILLLDNDETGRNATEKIARDLKLDGKEVYIAKYPEGIKDFNELVEKYGEEGAIDEYHNILYEALQNPFHLTKTLKEVGKSLITRLEERLIKAEEEGKERPEPLVLKTNIAVIDELLDGGLRRGLYGIAGQPAIGKTSFILALSKHLAEQDYKILIISLEMTEEDLLIQLLSWLTAIPKNKILDETVSRFELEDLKRALSSNVIKNIFIDTGSKNIDEIQNKVIEALNDIGEGRTVVFIDYLQQIKPSNTFAKSDYRLQLKDISYKLKEIANKHNLPVFVISSTQRDGYNNKEGEGKSKKSNSEPNYIAMFKESGDIEYSLYAGYFLDYPNEKELNELGYKKDKGELLIKIVKVKSRFGAVKDENHKNINRIIVLDMLTGRIREPIPY